MAAVTFAVGSAGSDWRETGEEASAAEPDCPLNHQRGVLSAAATGLRSTRPALITSNSAVEFFRFLAIHDLTSGCATRRGETSDASAPENPGPARAVDPPASSPARRSSSGRPVPGPAAL